MKSLRGKLLLVIGIILLVAQCISIFWVWHESEELIELHVRKALTADISPDLIDAFIHEEIMETMAALFLPALTTITLTMVFISVAISRLTKPLRELAEEIESRTSYHLAPLHVENASSELVVVEKSINQLLQRLGQGLENERRFTADVAHELRTPLAGLRLNLELIEESGVMQAQPLISRIDQMMLSIEQLLQLARAGQKLLEGNAQRFDLVQEVIRPMQMEWEEGISAHCALLWETPEQMMMVGDSGLIYLLLRNLLENVRNHAGEEGQATVRLSQRVDLVLLEVLDEGPGVSEDKISVLTQRFTRLDQTHKGHGLGLNIVNRIVMTHQGTLQIKNREDRSGLHVTVTFHGATIAEFMEL